MNPVALRLFHALPGPARSLAASVHGAYLWGWRYGPGSERLVAEALERETWSAERWQRWQQERLARLLHRAATRVPAYREVPPATDLVRWPVLDSARVRADPRAFVASDRDPRLMYPEHTSGTSGSPLRLWWTRETARAWYALFEARCRRWHGVSRRDGWANLGGQLVAPSTQDRPPFWVWNAPFQQLYMSSYHLAPAHARDYVRALETHRVTHLLGYASSLHSLASFVQEQGLRAPRMRVAISNAEPLFPHQRETITAAFGCPVRDTYGMAELACAASECPEGAFHRWPEVGIIEVLKDDSDDPVAPGQVGRLVCTGLLNQDMPLIRYETGDRGSLAPPDQTCPCGRSLPLLAEVAGRADDVIVTPAGRRVGRLDPVFKADLPIREAQIIQDSARSLRLKVVPTGAWSERHAALLVERLQARVGAMEVVVEHVDRIPRDAAGKFRAVVRQWTPP